MNTNRSSSAGNFVAGAVIGGAIGAVVALLFAPQSGEETRKMVKKKAQDFGRDMQDMKKELGPKLDKARGDLAKRFSK